VCTSKEKMSCQLSVVSSGNTICLHVHKVLNISNSTFCGFHFSDSITIITMGHLDAAEWGGGDEAVQCWLSDVGGRSLAS